MAVMYAHQGFQRYVDHFSEYWIEHVAIGPLYVKCVTSTKVFNSGVPGLCNRLSLRRLKPWINNHLHPVCWSPF